MVRYSPKRYFIPLAIIILLILIVLSYFIFRFFKTNSPNESRDTPIPFTSATPVNIPGYNNYKIKSLNLSFRVPFEYNVEVEDVPGDYINFYIQDYPINAPPPEPYFQMYGIYNESNLNYSDIQGIKKDLVNPKEENIGIFKTIQGTTKGERARYTFYLLLPKGFLTMAISDNSKGNPQKAKDIIATFEVENGTAKKCVIGGCSNELCVEEGSDTASICIWNDSFACYKDASCGVDSNGNCNWVMDEKLTNCIKEKT